MPAWTVSGAGFVTIRLGLLHRRLDRVGLVLADHALFDGIGQRGIQRLGHLGLALFHGRLALLLGGAFAVRRSLGPLGSGSMRIISPVSPTR